MSVNSTSTYLNQRLEAYRETETPLFCAWYATAIKDFEDFGD